MIYGWTRDYVLWELSLGMLYNHFQHGYEYDTWRRGWKLKGGKHEDTRPWDEIAEDYYTEDELKARERYLKKQFGNDIEGL